MSKQTSELPPDVERQHSSGRKRKGKWSLWMRSTRTGAFSIRWHRIRRYATREIAEANREDMHRKWNGVPGNAGVWEFEIREEPFS